MRLISADSIMRKMADMLNGSGNPLLAEKAIALIDHEPTAFDKEKVLGELMFEAEKSRKYWIDLDEESSFGEMSAYTDAIEIVERGGVYES